LTLLLLKAKINKNGVGRTTDRGNAVLINVDKAFIDIHPICSDLENLKLP
jgi:hypothetical protein